MKRKNAQNLLLFRKNSGKKEKAVHSSYPHADMEKNRQKGVMHRFIHIIHISGCLKCGRHDMELRTSVL